MTRHYHINPFSDFGSQLILHGNLVWIADCIDSMIRRACDTRRLSIFCPDYANTFLPSTIDPLLGRHFLDQSTSPRNSSAPYPHSCQTAAANKPIPAQLYTQAPHPCDNHSSSPTVDNAFAPPLADDADSTLDTPQMADREAY